MSSKINHEQNESKGSFFILSDGQRIAEMTYSKAGNSKIIIDHTGVDEAYRNEGYGKELVTEAVKFARKQSIKIIPLCPYAKSIFRRHEELRDVL